MASRYYFGAVLAAALAASSSHLTSAAAEEAERSRRELHGGGRGHDGRGGGWDPWASDGWPSSSSSTSGKSGKGSSSSSSSPDYAWHGGWGKPGHWGPSSSSSGSGKSGKSGGSKSSSSSSSHDWPGWGAHPSWHGGWPGTSSSSSSGKSGKSGGSSKGSKGSSSSSSSWDGPHWGPPGWHGGGWPGTSSSSSSSGKSGKSGGSKSSSSSSSYDGWHGWGKPHGWHHPGWPGTGSSSSSSGKSGKSGGGSKSSSSSSSLDGPWYGGWGGPHGRPGTSGSSSSSGKSGKSGGSKSGKGSSSSSSHDGGHWVWVGSPGGWSSSSSSSSGKSGKSGSSSGSSSTSTSWDGDGWVHDEDDDDDWTPPSVPLPPIYTVGGTVGGWKADGWDDDGHYKADIAYVRAQVTKLIDDSERELIPKFLRLGFHDCVGGCDGCVNLENADNKGLLEPIEAIYPIVEKFRESYSRADIWALATLVSADMSLLHGRPAGLTFPMRYFGRKDCHGASPKGVGGPDPKMPSNDFTTHELLDYFEDEFGFDADETVTIMGVHAVGVAHRHSSGFGNKDKEDGWVFDAESYVLDNRYYSMLVGHEGDGVDSAPVWHLELVHNDDGIPIRYQWYHEKDGEEERPIMTNADVALVRDLSDHIHVDVNGNEGAVDCLFKGDDKVGGHARRRTLQGTKKKLCPVASETIEKMIEYRMDNEMFLYDFEKVLEKMVKNGY